MTRLRRMVRAIGPLVVLLCSFTVPLDAQSSTLRIIRRTPVDSGTSGTIITVTFDRPVAGMLNSSIDPHRAFCRSVPLARRVLTPRSV